MAPISAAALRLIPSRTAASESKRRACAASSACLANSLRSAALKSSRNRTAAPIDRFKARVRELTRRTGGRSLSQVAKELSCYLIGWRGYFGFCETSVLRDLDQWTGRRLRAIAWKQWKRGRTRFARLRRRGVGRDLAAQAAGSPHGPWRLSNSPALTIALPNAFFAALGVATLEPKPAT